MDKTLAKQSLLLKLEATALFVKVRQALASRPWWYYRERQRLNRPLTPTASLTPYRASLSWEYLFLGIDSTVFLERTLSRDDAATARPWVLSFSQIEGKSQAETLQEHLKPFATHGYYIPSGNENLERQMNFSLGLYGDCLMHVDLIFPPASPPFTCFCDVFSALETLNAQQSPPLDSLLAALDAQRTLAALPDDPSQDFLIMGDWQTWK